MRSLQLAVLIMAAGSLGAQAPSVTRDLRFTDDFEAGLDRWIVYGDDAVDIVNAGAEHGRALRFRSNGDVHALIRGSDRWHDVAIEGDVMFPNAGDSYLGVIYNYRTRGARSDFGLIYVKSGRTAYLQANPHRDYNVTRTFYPEFVAPLSGAAEVRPGKWQRFRVEVVGGIAHFYVGDMNVPQLVFPIAEPGPGLVGLQPRSVGEDVWVDNVTVSSIQAFSHPVSEHADGGSMALKWDAIGPLAQTNDDIARHPTKYGTRWRSFAVDIRGGVQTSRVVDYHGPNTVAYFRAQVRASAAGPATLHLSTVDDLAVWVNGRFHWFVAHSDAAWFDAGVNPDHADTKIPLALVAGDNTLVFRVRGGVYAAAGFFAFVDQSGVRLQSP